MPHPTGRDYWEKFLKVAEEGEIGAGFDYISPSDIKLLEAVRRANLPAVDLSKEYLTREDCGETTSPAVTPDHLDDSRTPMKKE